MSEAEKLTKEEFARRWLIKAKNDFVIAFDERNLKTKDFITDGICFHCQQAVEKALKSFLVFHGIDFEKIHNLETLAALCSRIDAEFKEIDFGNLSDYGVAIRYPDNFYIPDLDETDKAISIADNVVKIVLNKLHFNLP
jgi:HEPN domain-containing protein